MLCEGGKSGGSGGLPVCGIGPWKRLSCDSELIVKSLIPWALQTSSTFYLKHVLTNSVLDLDDLDAMWFDDSGVDYALISVTIYYLHIRN
jgi:hypothetical protein